MQVFFRKVVRFSPVALLLLPLTTGFQQTTDNMVGEASPPGNQFIHESPVQQPEYVVAQLNGVLKDFPDLQARPVNSFELPEPTELTFKAVMLPLPEPIILKLTGVRTHLPEPFELQLKAGRTPLPDPSELQFKAIGETLPEPFELQLKAGRTPLPDPSELQLKAILALLPEPFELKLEGTRKPLPEPLELTFTAKRQIEWVIVPPVLGIDLTTAMENTKTAGLVPKPSLGRSANKREDKPGAVYETVPVVGKKVKRGSSLKLKTMGERPKVAVPAITGLSLEGANRKLKDVGLDIGKPSLGGPAPEGMQPGTVQNSVPEAGTMVAIFSVVRPILHGLKQVEVAGASKPPTDMRKDEVRTDKPITPSGSVSTAEGDCIPADQVKRVCYSRDGRDELCRQNNCNIPEKREKVCQSADGRHTMCVQNGCNPVFKNSDGSTFTIPCEWVEAITPAVPCYWKKEVPHGKRICKEGETPSTSSANLHRDDKKSADDSGDQQESGWAGRWNITAALGEARMTSVIEFSDESDGTFLAIIDVDNGKRTGHYKVSINDAKADVIVPIPKIGKWQVKLDRKGNRCSGVFEAHTKSGIGEWRITSCKRR